MRRRERRDVRSEREERNAMKRHPAPLADNNNDNVIIILQYCNAETRTCRNLKFNTTGTSNYI